MIEPVYADRAVYFSDDRVLVLADLHVGRSRTAPVEVPLDERVRLTDRILGLVRSFGAREVVLAGDVLDAFDIVPPGVPDRLASLQARLRAADTSLILCRGNHDTLIEGVYDGDPRSSYDVGDVHVVHGDERPTTDAALVVLGHEHPAIRIEGAKYPCYLVGRDVLDGTDVLVLPAFSRLVRGTTMNGASPSDLHAPLLRETGIDAFRPVLVDAPDLRFPTLAELRPFL